jgi:hypothetical protein
VITILGPAPAREVAWGYGGGARHNRAYANGPCPRRGGARRDTAPGFRGQLTVTASPSSPWDRFPAAGRAYWLPPGGIGNGLTAHTWAELVDVDASILILVMDTLRDAGIPAHAARVDWLGRRAPVSVFRIWVDTWVHSRAEDVARQVLLRYQPPIRP